MYIRPHQIPEVMIASQDQDYSRAQHLDRRAVPQVETLCLSIAGLRLLETDWGCWEGKRCSRYYQNPSEYGFHTRFLLLHSIVGAQLNIGGAQALPKRYNVTPMIHREPTRLRVLQHAVERKFGRL